MRFRLDANEFPGLRSICTDSEFGQDTRSQETGRYHEKQVGFFVFLETWLLTTSRAGLPVWLQHVLICKADLSSRN